jgi:hypothetical protein
MNTNGRGGHINMKKLVCGITVMAAVAGATATSALASKSTTIYNCASRAVSAPRQLTLFCGDGNDTLSAMHWQSWGAATATTTGTEQINLCEPNCAAGHDHDYGVRVSASDLKSNRYQRLSVTFTGKRPKGTGRVQSFDLTAHGPIIS